MNALTTTEALSRLVRWARAQSGNIAYSGDHPIATAEMALATAEAPVGWLTNKDGGMRFEHNHLVRFDVPQSAEVKWPLYLAALTPSEPSPMLGCDVRDALTLYRMARDLCDEVGAADTLLGRPEVARSKAVALRDALGAWQPRTALTKPPVEPAAGVAEGLLRDAWAGYVNLSADMEAGPLQKQMRNHASRIADYLESLEAAQPPAPQAPAAQADGHTLNGVPWQEFEANFRAVHELMCRGNMISGNGATASFKGWTADGRAVTHRFMVTGYERTGPTVERERAARTAQREGS